VSAPTAIALTNAAGAGSPAAPSPAGGSDRPQVDHASLQLFESKPATGGAMTGASLGSIQFQFNPKELSITKSAKWERKPARGAKKAGPPEFSGADPCKLTLEMFFDATGKHDGSVVASVEKLFTCCVPTEASHGQKKAVPPLVVFTWGNITSFPAYVSTVSAKYTLFSADGTPIRATCSVTLEEMPGENGPQNPTSGSLAARRVHRTVTGDSLASLAYAEYGDATLWRRLAEFNGIDDPSRLPSGALVLLPAVDELLGQV
jgi:nucleoid-associated protein YgaU